MVDRPCYVRFNHLNPMGRSYNYRDGFWERGNSVYTGICTERNHYYLQYDKNGAFPQTLTQCVFNHLMRGQPIFEVTGRLLEERGSDGEALLLDVEIVRELEIREGVIVSK